MKEDRTPKRIFTQELKGTRRTGRPRKRWIEEVEGDLQVMGVKRWRTMAIDRKKMEGYCSTGQRILLNRPKDIVQQAKGYCSTGQRMLFNRPKDTVQQAKGYCSTGQRILFNGPKDVVQQAKGNTGL
jgi:ribosomal protein L20